MNLLRRLGLFICGSLMRLFLFATITVTVLVIVFNNSGYIKSALTDTTAYSRFVPSIIEANEAAGNSENTIPFNDPNIQKIIIESFDSEDLQDKAETVVDSMFSWLRGQTNKPDFKLDFTSNKQKMADNLSAYAFWQMQGLPVCMEELEFIDPFYTACRPVNMDYAAEQLSLSKQLFDSPKFLKETVITVDDFAKDEKGRTIIDRLDYAPNVYRWMLKAPWILGSLTFVFGLGYVLLSRRHREGVSAVGFAIIGSSVSLIFLTFIFGFVLPYFSKNLELGLGGGGTQAIFDNAISSLTKTFDTMVINVSIQMLALGALVVFLEKLTKPSKYDSLLEKSGVATDTLPRAPGKKFKARASEIPIMSSDDGGLNKVGHDKNKKYRKIPRGDI